MADISERKKDGKVVSFKFVACLGRDEAGKRIMKATTLETARGTFSCQSAKNGRNGRYSIRRNLPILCGTEQNVFEGHCGRYSPFDFCETIEKNPFRKLDAPRTVNRPPKNPTWTTNMSMKTISIWINQKPAVEPDEKRCIEKNTVQKPLFHIY